MRTTIDIADELFRRAKARAADEGIPLREIVEASLRRYLSSRRRDGKYKLRWKTVAGRLQPGVNLDDRDSLFDRMDGRE